MSLSESIVDVGTESVKRRTTLFVVFGTAHFSATDTTRDGHLDTFGTHAHGGGDGSLDGATILDAAFNLFGDLLSNEDGVEFRTFHLGDVDLDIFARDLLEFLFQFVNLGTVLADDETRTSGVDGNG